MIYHPKLLAVTPAGKRTTLLQIGSKHMIIFMIVIDIKHVLNELDPYDNNSIIIYEFR